MASTSSGAAAAVAPARVRTEEVAPQQKRNVAIWILAVVFLFLAAIWLQQVNRRSSVAQQQAVQSQPKLHTQSTGSVAFTVNAGSTHYFKFTVPDGALNVTLKGHFTATGGTGNDIQVALVTEDQYVNWQNGHETKTFYNSGKVTQDTLNVSLPSDATTYYLVFSNKFSLLTPKAVHANMDLNYYAR
ncbi:MAG: hypothetical protein WAQ52_08685 [Terriglobales bacterium]